MNWDALGAIAELAGAVAVVASLLYVGRQFRHSSTYALESIYYQAIASFTSSTEVASVVVRGMSDLDSLTDEELYHFWALFYQLFSAIEQLSEQSTRGLANASSVERVRKLAHVAMVSPAFQTLWHHGSRINEIPLKEMYSPRFVAELEEAAGTKPAV